jgi:hypothetical protein
MLICRKGETAEHRDDPDHGRRTPSPRSALAPLTVCVTGILSCCSLTGSAGARMLSYLARAARIRRARSRSDFGTNRITSPIFEVRSLRMVSLIYDDTHSILTFDACPNFEALQAVTILYVSRLQR